MVKAKIFILTIIVFFICSAWGFYAHKKINETAVFLLPAEMAVFYKKHIRTITERATDPDKRCYVDTAEGPRHFIDLDRFEENIDSIPIHWSKAKEKYTERRLLTQGVVPWQIWRSYQNLVQAFIKRDQNKIIKYSADIGHYIADAHVPLHTTSNYNGQFTDQIGIHAFWETRLPEMFSAQYDLFIGPAVYIADPLQAAWDIVKESHARVDSVLHVEKRLSEELKESDRKTYLTRNGQLIFTYSDSYATAYHHALNGMVERRLRSSIYNVASYWYSAWIDAGQPKLIPSLPENITVEEPTPVSGQKSLGREEWH
ncbi:zinc dependent phospholipase C family protein [Sphingobacterium sp. SGG-5]|uniref:zinc dependent phospholipase C family protein n=1 Tax=Sphingobacterium sp. SGG-5 TaxID=2710881 RepID=UPI0019D0F1FE|nr:zinc dependent phospholipase C family protein [Sphingobacterium sp. SGG-5]